MTIQLPGDLENSLRSEVLNGRFANADDAAAEILRDYFRRKASAAATMPGDPHANGGLGSIGAMKEDADLMDQVVEHAMRVREERPWRLKPVE